MIKLQKLFKHKESLITHFKYIVFRHHIVVRHAQHFPFTILLCFGIHKLMVLRIVLSFSSILGTFGDFSFNTFCMFVPNQSGMFSSQYWKKKAPTKVLTYKKSKLLSKSIFFLPTRTLAFYSLLSVESALLPIALCMPAQ